MYTMKDLSEILQAFSGSTLQSVSQVRRKLKEHNISWKEFDEFIATYKPNERKASILTCPECGGPAKLHTINSKPCNQVEGNFESMWACDACGWNQMNIESAIDINKTVKKPKRKPKGRIIRPNEHKMLYYGNTKRRR